MTVPQWFAMTGEAGVLVPLLSISALIAGGIILLIYGVRMHGALPSRRLRLMRSGTGLGRWKGVEPGWEEAPARWYAQDFSHEERWQIVRSFTKLGVPPSRSLALFAVTRFLSAAIAGAIAFSGGPGASPMLPVLFGAAASIAGWLLPTVAIGFQLKQHRKSVGSGLPEALELLAICAGAGLSLENAFQRVAAEVKAARPALSDELALTWAEISISPSREQALANMAERVNLPAVRSVIGTLSQSLRFGTPLTQSLRVAANEMRNLQLIELEERATRLPALLTVPVMLFIMPSLFLIVGGPAAIKLLDMFHPH